MWLARMDGVASSGLGILCVGWRRCEGGGKAPLLTPMGDRVFS